ncbi:MAG: class I tRNA ligase family protein, partial [Novosphingobium sp.]|nr:class I tRNA ligase family protein [Novosphingobium sp.]MCB2076983.1 class I tRNA ligase family protein [Novosphingobium sp.]
QHRGWFQSSLLESCATRGHAPYKAILTHGFTMDAKGMKMSKSLGNTVDPLKVMEQYGADIIRLWALSVDYTEDHRIGDEIMKGVADQYRKIRNTFRYLLGALADFDMTESVDVADMPELERYVLALLGRLDETLRRAVSEFDFNTYVREISDFCNEDLSAFFFDIRKDCLYCDAPSDPKRRAYRKVLDVLFHALVRYASPVLVFTAEEVWRTRYPDRDSVHLLEWPELPELRHSRLREDDELLEKWETLRKYRSDVTEAIEPLRREKKVGSGLEAEIAIDVHRHEHLPFLENTDLAELFISGEVNLVDEVIKTPYVPGRASEARIVVNTTSHHKCGRCWRHLPDVSEDGALCGRCETVVGAMEASA